MTSQEKIYHNDSHHNKIDWDKIDINAKPSSQSLRGQYGVTKRVSKQDSEKLLQGSVQGRIMERNISVIKDVNGNQIVIVNDIRFKGKRNIDWDEVEQYLKQYVGEFIEIAESKEIIYIGSDLPDEYSGSNYTAKLKGALAKAKANAAQGIPEMIEIAQNKRFRENLERKHDKNAKYGWYRYDSRFAIPVFDENNDVLRYNIFHAELVIRHSENRKLYLYDIINIKKETSTPLEP